MSMSAFVRGVAVCATAFVTVPTACGQIAPPPDLTFWGSHDAGHRFYGSVSPDDCLNPSLTPGVGSGYVPSICWGPRTMWETELRQFCDNPFNPRLSGTAYSMPFGRDGATDAQLSAWWGRGIESVSGLGMNINLEIGAAPPTLPPASFDPYRDGSALVPPNPSMSTRPVAMQTRPMLGDSVDLVTGIPMIQETDLELPFGSALYRHTRTYSEMPPGRFEAVCYDHWLNQPSLGGLAEDDYYTTVAGEYFDWHGQGWMMGEAPLFLIDAHYDQVVYDGNSQQPSPRRCYFVINAFQSIPFDFDGEGEYVAPPHLDAFLEHNGDWGGSGWVEPPTIFRVWLYNKSVCYTVRAMYEDVFPGMIPDPDYEANWPNAGPDIDPRSLLNGDDWPRSDHDTPIRGDAGDDSGYLHKNLGANGVPYWGVVERIDDRYGNCIDLHYCDFRVYAVAGADQDAFDWEHSGDTCYACCQSCNEKGQIAYARLIAGSDFDPITPLGNQPATIIDDQDAAPDVAWTLLFTHRSFPQYHFLRDDGYRALDSVYPYHQQTAVHTIHVYEGALPDAADLVCRTIDYHQFVDDNGSGPPSAGYDTILDPIDEINAGIGNAARAIPSGWTYELRYMYAEPDPRLDRDNIDEGTTFDVSWYRDAFGFACPHPGGASRLLKVTTTTAQDDGEGGVDLDSEYTLYRWDSRSITAQDMTSEEDLGRRELLDRLQYSELTTLKAIYRPAQVADILQRLAAWDPMPWTVNMLVLGDHPDSDLLAPCDNQEGFYATLDSFDFELGTCVGETERPTVSMLDLASSVLLRWNRMPPGLQQEYVDPDIQIYGTFEEFEHLTGNTNKFADDLMANFVLSSDGSGHSSEDYPADRFKYKLIVPGVHMIRGTNTSDPADQRAYRIYRFMYLENALTDFGEITDLCWSWFEAENYEVPRRSVYHTPYRDDPRMETNVAVGPVNDGGNGQLRNVTWVTVVDEYDSLSDMELMTGSEAIPGALGWPERGSEYLKLPNRRRTIRMNAAGWVLSEHIWEFGDEGTSFARTGASEEFVYDDFGRLTQHKTLSWGTEENQNQEEEGLVNVFEYTANIDGNNDGDFHDKQDHIYYEIGKRGIQFGDGSSSEPIWLEEHVYHDDRRDLRVKSMFYSEAGQAPTYTTNTFYDFVTDIDGDQQPEDSDEWLLLRRTVLGPAMKVGVGTAEGHYHPFETHIYSDVKGESGRLLWRSHGLKAPEGSGGDTRFESQYFDYTHYDYSGRISRQVVDLKENTALGGIEDLQNGGSGLDDPDPEPNGLSYPSWSVEIDEGTTWNFGGPGSRQGTGEPLHSITKLLHKRWGTWIKEVPYGPVDAVGGRQTRTYRPKKVGDGTKEQRVAVYTGTYDDAVLAPEGQITILGGGRPSEVKKVHWLAGTGTYPYNHEFVELVDLDIKYDSKGTPNQVEATGWDGKKLSAEAEVDHFGGFTRERQPDGTITRTYRDPFGRAERIFRGVQDKNEFWGYVTSGEDDLVLIEQRRYGMGPTNIHQITMNRHFRERPAGQYENWDWPNEGWVEWHGYDNRLREVWNRLVVPGTEQYDADGMIIGGDSLRTQVTLYDNLDRVVLVAEYGQNAPAAPDSSGTLSVADLEIDGDGTLPQGLVPMILSGQEAPLSLSETIYNEAGLVLEQRSYDVSDSSGDTYLATVTHYDGSGRPLIQIAPNTAPVIYNYDAMGRLVSRRVVRNVVDDPPFEIQRTDTTYDSEGNAIVVESYERLHDDASGAPVLTAAGGQANCVASAVWNWFDAEGRLIATANLGSGNASDDQFVTPTGGLPEFTLAMYNNPPTVDQTGTVSRGDSQSDHVPDWATVTCYLYNTAGQKWIEAIQTTYEPGAQTEHTYCVNTYEYDGLGNMVYWKENAAGSSSNQTRQTAYLYENGRLKQIAAVLPGHSMLITTGANGELSYHRPDWDATDGTLQVTLVDYDGPDLEQGGPLSNGEQGLGARVWTGELNSGGNPIWSHNKTWPAAVYFPNKATGQPDLSGGPDLEFTYYTDGLVRSRIDRLGREFIHHYDTRSQRVKTEIVYPTGLFPDVGGTHYTPNDLADLLLYTYDEQGRLEDAIAGQDLNDDGLLDETNDLIIAHNRYTYHDQGALASEYQSYGELIKQETLPAIEYERDYAGYGSGNRDRLARMVYAQRAQSSEQRAVTLWYGSAPGDIDDALSRVTRISDTTSLDPDRAVDFRHSGSSRRVARSWLADDGGALGEVFAQSFDTTGTSGYAGLDRHGRVTDLHFTPDSGATTIHRYQYGYDSAGNRLFAHVEQEGQVNTRSWLYGYDPLGRLTSAEHGQLNLSTGLMEFSAAVDSHRVDWGLDRLGNWTAATNGHQGRVEYADLNNSGADGYESLVLAQDHATDLRNEMTGIETDDGSGPINTAHIHGAAGNLVADGSYYYQYDAFNRVAAIYELGTLTFNGAGIPSTGEPGAWRSSYAYDALGRRISRQVPWSGQSDSRWSWYYYDGVRRIAEVHRDPLPQAGIGGNPIPQGSYTTYTDREYVWGPDYVDECLWQVDRTGTAAFVLQDANYNVVALVDEQGDLLQQYDYDPYGTVLAADSLSSYANNRIGFQGLFVDRYDADAPLAELVPAVDQTYHARNRDYRPDVGRWLLRDPNGTSGQTLDAVHSGRQVAIEGQPFDATQHYVDGMHTLCFVRNSPTIHTDSMGRFVQLLAPTSTLDIYTDYNDQALDVGMSISERIEAAFANYGSDQALSLEAATEWAVDDRAFAGAVVVGLRIAIGDRHHVIPQFLMGVDDAANRLRLPPRQHRLYHRLLREEFTVLRLNPPNSRGAKRWVTRFLNQRVSDDEVDRLRRAMMNTARRFDSATDGAFDVARRTRLGLNSRHYLSGALDVRRTRRGR